MPTDDDRKANASAEDALARIAATLGCPVEVLTGELPDNLNTKGLSELLTIWAEMGSDADRAKLLDFARTLAKA